MPRDSITDLDPRLAALAERQGGVFSSRQAHDLGVGPDEIQLLRRRRVLVSVRRGVYAYKAVYDGLDPLARHRTGLAALGLVLVEPAVISHESAAVEHGLALLLPDLSEMHVTRSDTAGSRREAGVHHHSAGLPGSHVVEVAGRLMTSLARTGIDVARTSGRLECGVAVLDSVLRAGIDPVELREVMDYCRSWDGARLASRALSMADGRAANPGESWSRVVLVGQGLPPSDLQRPLFDEDGLIGYVDFVLDELQLVGEFDGRWKYDVPEGADPRQAGLVVWQEKRREDRIRGIGYGVVRWGWEDLYYPARLGARVRAAAARQAQRRWPAR
ncbi:MAG TPA: type IV toxin-antitoxin system AbiEi family antitoxin domain-containing protein [Nocardioidaceae bacterium]